MGLSWAFAAPYGASITADMPQRSTLRRSRRACRALILIISAACTQLSCLVIALVITSRRVIARASHHTRRSISCIERLYRTRRTSLNVYTPDISNVYDTGKFDLFSFFPRHAMLRLRPWDVSGRSSLKQRSQYVPR